MDEGWFLGVGVGAGLGRVGEAGEEGAEGGRVVGVSVVFCLCALEYCTGYRIWDSEVELGKLTAMERDVA